MGNKLKLNDLKVGMIVGFDQLTDIYDTWILCTVEDTSKPLGQSNILGTIKRTKDICVCLVWERRLPLFITVVSC